MYHTNEFQADNIKNTSSKCHLTYILLQFFFALGSNHDYTDCWSAHKSQLPASASNVYTTDARMGGIGRWHRPGGIGRMPPKQKPWLRRCPQSCNTTILYTLIINQRNLFILTQTYYILCVLAISCVNG